VSTEKRRGINYPRYDRPIRAGSRGCGLRFFLRRLDFYRLYRSCFHISLDRSHSSIRWSTVYLSISYVTSDDRYTRRLQGVTVATDKLFTGQANGSWDRLRTLQMHTNVGDILFRLVPRLSLKAGFPIRSLHSEIHRRGMQSVRSGVWVIARK